MNDCAFHGEGAGPSHLRRQVLPRVAAVLAALVPWCSSHGAESSAAKSQPPSRPNIVFILADDLGWTDLGCYGSKYYQTPNIDRMAAEGMRFTSGYTCGPNCQPTRAA